MPNVEWIGAHGTNYTAGRGGRSVDTIGIHYTATNASAKNNGIYFSRPNANASAHYFIDGSGTIVQSVSERDTAWALGDWAANQRAISIEVVSAGQDFTESEIQELAWLVKDIKDRYGISDDRIIRHYDVTGKHCPAPYVDGYKWSELKNRIVGGGNVSGWVQQDGGWWYRYSDGTYPAGEWEMINGVWYLFDSDGWMQTGWHMVGDYWYYMDSSGEMKTGWQKIGGVWYHLGKDGAMDVGWKYISGSWYYMDETGEMKTGWRLVDGNWYYMGADGAMRTDWVEIDGKDYYLGDDGAMRTGLCEVRGKTYMLDEYGVIRVGKVELDGKRLFFKVDGSMARNEIAEVENGSWYAFKDDGDALDKVNVAEDGCISF